VFHGGAVKKYRAPLLGIEEIDYHPHGLHALRTGRLANAEKNHRQIARILKMRGGHFSSLSCPKRRNASKGGRGLQSLLHQRSFLINSIAVNIRLGEKAEGAAFGISLRRGNQMPAQGTPV
jgi:hypothetical protein